jgi:hypothetical protein
MIEMSFMKPEGVVEVELMIELIIEVTYRTINFVALPESFFSSIYAERMSRNIF